MTITRNRQGAIVFPPINKELIETLEEVFPERCPNKSQTDREIWIYSGKRELVRYLKSVYEHQNLDNVYESNLFGPSVQTYENGDE